MANAFDQFDGPAQRAPAQAGGNPFDAFDELPAVGLQTAQTKSDDGPGLVSNSLRNAGERGFDLLGNAIQFVGNAAEKGEEAATEMFGGFNPGVRLYRSQTLRDRGHEPDLEIGGFGIDFTTRLDPDETDTGLTAAGQAVEDVGLGYKPNYTVDKALDEPTLRNLAGAVAEQGPAALADMAALIVSTPAYLASRTQEIGEARVENDGGDIRNASPELQQAIVQNFADGTPIPEDLQREAEYLAENGGMPELKEYLISGPTAAASVLLDRFALGRLLPGGGKAITSARQIPGAVGRATVTEATTEAVQEGGIEYAGETIGTREGWDSTQAWRRAAGGALVGGPTGGAVRGGTAGYELATSQRQPQGLNRESVGEGVRMDAEPGQEGIDVTPGQTYGNNPFDQFDQTVQGPETAGATEQAAPETPVITAPAEQQQATDDGAPIQQQGITESGTGVFRVPVDQIQVDPEQYQFRSRVNDQGVDKRLSGVDQWDDNRAGTVLLHRREDGSLYVADGHHRVDLARRLGQGEINARVVDEADGVDVPTARVEAAMNNIADGKAEPLDVAKVFRDSGTPAGDVRQAFNLPNNQVVRDGEALANLSDNVFGMVSAGQMNEKDGAAIGAAFTEASQQEAAADAFTKVQPETDYQRQLLVNEIRAAEFAEAQGEQGGLFGDDPQEVSLMQDRLKVLDALRQRLNTDRRLFKSLNDNADRAGEVGNQIATEANESITKQSARSLDLIGRVTTTPALNEMVNRAARRVYDGENRSQVVKDLKQELMAYEQGTTAESSGRPSPAPRRQQADEQRAERGSGERVPEQDAAGADQAAQPESGQQSQVTLTPSTAKEQGLYGWRQPRNGRGYVYSVQKGGQEIGFLDLAVLNDGTARIMDVVAHDGSNSIGARDVRRLMRQILDEHPGITEFTGERVSGIRRGGEHGFAGTGTEVRRKVRSTDAANLVDLPYGGKQWNDDTKTADDVSGTSSIVDMGGRRIVVVDVNGVKVPFYQSTGAGGKKETGAGKWYPFTGIGQDGWINKLGGRELADYYGSPALREAAENLDNTLGDIRSRTDIPKTGRTGAGKQFVDTINSLFEGQTPTDNNTQNARASVDSSIAALRSALGESQANGRRSDAPAQPALELETQTEEQLAEQERTRQEVGQAEARARREEEQRADADDQVDSFTLTGSDRPADVAMAAGQDDMFVSTPASREAEPAPREPAVRRETESQSVWAGKLEDYAKQQEAIAADWASRQYKNSRQSIDLEGDGPRNSESVSVNNVNENRRRRRVNDALRNAKMARELAKQDPTDILARYAKQYERVSQWPTGRHKGDTFENNLVIQLNKEFAGEKQSVYGKETLGAILHDTLEPMHKAEQARKAEAEAERKAEEAKERAEFEAEQKRRAALTPDERRAEDEKMGEELLAQFLTPPEQNEQAAADTESTTDQQTEPANAAPSQEAEPESGQADQESEEPTYSRVGEQEADYDTIQGVRANWSRAGIQHSIRESNGIITVDKIVVPDGLRGDGRGTEAMRLLLDYADRSGQTVALSPSTDFGGKKFRLKRFYRRLGFSDNKGSNRNFEISESMLREPKPVDDNQQPAQDGVEGRRSAYRANPNQGDLFTDMESLDQLEQVDAYDNLETRPGTAEAQRDAGRSALRDLFRQLNARYRRTGRLSEEGPGVSLLGAAIYKDFKEGKPNQLIGQTARTPHDLAALAQVYRDPRFETFRFILTKDGVVVGEQAVTSRLPAAVAFDGNVIPELELAMASYEADGYYMLHNHPSGKSDPSMADLETTKRVAKQVPGFQSHVVINFNEFSAIDADGVAVRTQDDNLNSLDLWSNPEKPNDFLGFKVTSAQHIVGIAKNLQNSPDRVVYVGTSARGKVTILTSLPARLAKNLSANRLRRREALATLRRLQRASGTGGYGFLIAPTSADAVSMSKLIDQGVVRDIVTADGYSAQNDFVGEWRRGAVESVQSKALRVGEDQADYDVPTLDPDPFGPPSDTIVRRAVSKIADKFTVLKGVQEQIKKSEGQIPEQADAYMAEELFHGKVENDIRLIRERMIEPLTERMAEYGVTLKQLDEFLYAMHAPERNRVIAERNPEMPDGGSGMTNAEAAKVIEKVDRTGKLGQYKELAGRVHRMLEMRRDILRDAGLLDEDALGAWEASYRAYVPLKGFAADEAPDGRPRIGKGFAIAGKESQLAGGRRSRAASPVANSISDLSEAVLRHRKNEVGQAFMSLVQMYPNDSYWRIYSDENPEVERKPVRVKDPETGKMKVEVREQTVPMAMMSDRYFTTKVGGKTYYIKIEDQRLMNAMRNIGPDNNNILVRSLAAVTRVMSSLNTSYNPEFVISNFSRDIQTALLNLTSEQSSEDGKARGKKIAAKTLKDTGTAIRAINASLKGRDLTGKAGRWQKHFDQFRADGAKTGWFDMKDVDGQMRDMEKLVKLAQGGTISNIRKTFRAVTEWVDHTNGAIENGVRLSAYVNAIEAGIPRAQAASLAKNMTVNFNRRGEWGTTMNAVYMFANASVQGTNNFIRTLGRLNGHKGDRIWRRMNTAQKIAAGMAVGGFMLSLLNRLAAGEDDDEVNWWDKVPDYIKERNIVVMKSLVGGEPGEYWTIPLPYGYNIFPVMGTQLEHLAFSENQSAGQAASNTILAALGSFSPIGFEESQEAYGTVIKNITPTVLRPISSISLNENFMGGPIYKENFPFGTPKPDSSLYFRSTPEMFKLLAKNINEATGGNEQMSGAADWSPDVMNYLVAYYGGGAYDFFTSRSPNFVTKALTGVELEDREVPFWRKIHGKVLPYEDQSIFYDRRDEINQLVERREALKPRERGPFVREYRDKLRLKPIMDSTEKRLRRLRDQRDRIEMRDDLSMAERDERLQDVEARIKREIDRFNQRYNEADD